MKYSEFRKLINDKGLEIFDGGSVLVTCPNTDRVYMMIDKDNTHKLTTSFSKFSELSVCDRQILLDWAIKLASTPLDEREDEKKYYLKLDSTIITNLSYLYFSEYDGEFEISSENEYESYKTAFTETEITELEEKHDLSMFVKEEVE